MWSSCGMEAEEPEKTTRAARKWALVALAGRRSIGGVVGVVALSLAALTTLGAVVTAIVITRARGYAAPLYDVPSVTALVLSWGPGVLFLAAASQRALLHDREAGILALVRARGVTTTSYTGARAGGLALLLLLLTAGGTAVAGVACLALAPASSVGLVLRGVLAAIVYCLAFTATLCPLALAASGSRSRGGGYFALALLLLVPELLRGWTSKLVPDDFRGLVSIPSALAELRASLMPPGAPELAHLLRAAVVLAVVAFLALLLVRLHVARADQNGALPA